MLLSALKRRIADQDDYPSYALALAASNAINLLQLAANAGVLTGTGTPTNPYMGWDQVPIASDRHYYMPRAHYSKIGEWKINATNEILQRVSISGDPAGTFIHITATNAVQKLHLQNVNGGTYPLWYGGAKTTLNWNDSAATVQAALRTLTGINTLTVGTWAFNDGSQIGQPGNPYKITFPAGGPYPVLSGDPTNLTADLTKASGSHPFLQPTVVCFGEAAVSLGPTSNASATDANNNITLENLVIDCTGTCGVGLYLGKWFYGRVRNVRVLNFTPGGVTYSVVVHDDCTYVTLENCHAGAWGLTGLVGLDGNPLPTTQPGNGQVPQYALCASIGLCVGGGPYYNGNPFVKTVDGQFLGMFHQVPDTSNAAKICTGSTTGADNQVVITGFTVDSSVKAVLLTSGTTKTVRGFYGVTGISGQTLTLNKNPRLSGGETGIRVVINPTPLPMTGIGALVDGGTNGFKAEGTSFNLSERHGVYFNGATRDCVLDRIDAEEVAFDGNNYTVAVAAGSPAISVAATKFHRADGGSFVNDGFRVGQNLYARGWANAANNGVFPISVVTASDLTVTGTTLVNEAAGNGVAHLDVLDRTSLVVNGQYHRVENVDAAPRARVEGRGHRFHGGANWLNSGTAYLHINNSDDSEFVGPAAFDPSSKGLRRRVFANPAVFGMDRFPTGRMQRVYESADVNGNLDGNPSGNNIDQLYCTDASGNLLLAFGIGAGAGRDTIVIMGITGHNVYLRPSAQDTVGSIGAGALILQTPSGHFQIWDENGNPLVQNGYHGFKLFETIYASAFTVE